MLPHWSCRWNLISNPVSVHLTPGQPLQALTLWHQVTGRVARVPNLVVTGMNGPGKARNLILMHNTWTPKYPKQDTRPEFSWSKISSRVTHFTGNKEAMYYYGCIWVTQYIHILNLKTHSCTNQTSCLHEKWGWATTVLFQHITYSKQ